ncbi:MAG: hypothetical protein AB1814_00170 [Thermodesulfobacteriota bacterium]
MRLRRLICLAAALFMAGCGGLYAPVGDHPARLVVAVAGRISQADIDRAVADKIGPLEDQPTLDHWLGPPFWQVQVSRFGGAGAVWRLQPLSGLALPQVGLAAKGLAEFLTPAGPGRYRLFFSCVVTHYWSEGLRTYQEPIYVRMWGRDMQLNLPAGGRLELDPFSGPGRP